MISTNKTLVLYIKFYKYLNNNVLLFDFYELPYNNCISKYAKKYNLCVYLNTPIYYNIP